MVFLLRYSSKHKSVYRNDSERKLAFFILSSIYLLDLLIQTKDRFGFLTNNSFACCIKFLKIGYSDTKLQSFAKLDYFLRLSHNQFERGLKGFPTLLVPVLWKIAIFMSFSTHTEYEKRLKTTVWKQLLFYNRLYSSMNAFSLDFIFDIQGRCLHVLRIRMSFAADKWIFSWQWSSIYYVHDIHRINGTGLTVRLVPLIIYISFWKYVLVPWLKKIVV